jgi:hypothetical protein
MKYYIPDIDIAQAGSLLYEKLGGAPVGLPPDRWPACQCCGKPQGLIAQFRHDAQRLSLGREGRVLYVFQCNNPDSCYTWDRKSGANACVVLEPEELTAGVTSLPVGAFAAEKEAFVHAWSEREDLVQSKHYADFFSKSEAHFDLEDDVQDSVVHVTRLGSVPAWLQSSGEAPGGFRFLGQISEEMSFYRTVPRGMGLQAWQTRSSDRDAGRTHYLDGPNFGGGGMAYLFCEDKGGAVPEVCFFWQC